MQQKKKLLIIDREPVSETLISYFEKFEFEIIHKLDISAIDYHDDLPTALLIDWSIAQKNKGRLLKLLTDFSDIPVIIVHHEENENTCIQALEEGADDFFSKSRTPRELHARINAIIKRMEKINPSREKEVLAFANWRLYPGPRQLYRDGVEYKLSPSEYNLLLAFVRHPQQILKRDYLRQKISQQRDKVLSDRLMDTHISRLRQKIESDPKHPRLIKTVRNTGYLFNARVSTGKGQSI